MMPHMHPRSKGAHQGHVGDKEGGMWVLLQCQQEEKGACGDHHPCGNQ